MAATLQIANGLLGGVVLFGAGKVIEGLTGTDADWGATWPWIIALALATGLSGVMNALVAEQQTLVGEYVHRYTSQRLIDAVSRVPFRRFDSGSFHDRLQRAGAGSEGASTSIVWGIVGTTRTLIDTVVIVGVLLLVVPVVIPIGLAAYVPLLISTRRSNRLLHGFDWDLAEHDRQRKYLSGLFLHREHAREIRMFDLGRWFGDRHADLWSERIDRLRAVVRRRMVWTGFGSLVSATVSAVALGAVAWLASRGSISLSEAGVGVLGVRRLSGGMSQLNGSISMIHRSGLTMRDYEEFVRLAEQAHERSGGRTPPKEVTEIVVDGLTFGYPLAARRALDDVSFTLRRGEVVAVVGPNGAGKTSLMLLLCGLYRADAGTICWDGVNIDDFDSAQFRSLVAPMFQDFTRYQLTTRTNIEASDLGAQPDENRLKRAIDRSESGPVVDRLEHGLDTWLSRSYRGGSELSSGQWQRLAAARALYHGGPLLILDEPSADLDALTERRLLDQLAEHAREQSVLFISHRFSAVRRADRILVLEGGRLVEEGTHDELIAKRGLYANMYETQMGGA